MVTTSTARNVTHTYSQTGTYNVSLYVANAAGGNTSTPQTINVSPISKNDIGVFRPSAQQFIFNTSPVTRTKFGLKSDIPITGD